jgi:hypothetical protein
LTAISTPSWSASAPAARWAACRRGLPNTLRTRNLCWPTRPVRSRRSGGNRTLPRCGLLAG